MVRLLALTLVAFTALSLLCPKAVGDPSPKLVVHWTQTCPDAAHPATLKYCPI